jgi:hypothetical protein
MPESTSSHGTFGKWSWSVRFMKRKEPLLGSIQGRQAPQYFQEYLKAPASGCPMLHITLDLFFLQPLMDFRIDPAYGFTTQ